MENPILNTDFYIIPDTKTCTSIGNPETASVAIILKAEDHQVHKDLLINILKAIKIDVEQDVVFFLLGEGESFHIASAIQDNVKYVMCFGLGIKDIGMHASFQANTFYPTETFTIMLTHSLSKLDADKLKKKNLWSALQSTFLK